MRKTNLSILILILLGLNSFAQLHRPKVIVGIVVDQMRPDYLSRFYNQFGNGGFKTLMSDGFTMWNIHTNYIPTYTGPGHASIYSGTTPRYSGIIGNDIYNREIKKAEYCVKDTFSIVGNTSIVAGNGMSPHRLIATNICDELKLCTHNQSKIVSISLKDRAAILSAGHLADYAFWFDQKTGNFITSSYYTKQLPAWLLKFNDQNLASAYSSEEWMPLYDSKSYSDCVIDTSLCTTTTSGNKVLPLFPHVLKLPGNSKDPKYSPLYKSPFANTLLTDLAIEAIKNNGFGLGENPDLLAISYSSTDAVGHLFGPLSKEVKDTYLRLDKDLERLLKALDQYVGKGNYVLFLTADHGIPEIPQYLVNRKIPAGLTDHEQLIELASEFLDSRYSPGKWIDTLMNDQFFLNRELISERGLDLRTVQFQLADFLMLQKGIAFAYTASGMTENEFTANIGMYLQNGFQPKNSGDVLLIMEPNYFEYEEGYLVEHGSGYNYDTNIPLIWYGQNIRKGESWQLHYITDIAPTLSMILRIKYPSACIGNPMPEIYVDK
jgi:predicted AlkP superfamily pyrophosphatase or phosphodiesterase